MFLKYFTSSIVFGEYKSTPMLDLESRLVTKLMVRVANHWPRSPRRSEHYGFYKGKIRGMGEKRKIGNNTDNMKKNNKNNNNNNNNTKNTTNKSSILNITGQGFFYIIPILTPVVMAAAITTKLRHLHSHRRETGRPVIPWL